MFLSKLYKFLKDPFCLRKSDAVEPSGTTPAPNLEIAHLSASSSVSPNPEYYCEIMLSWKGNKTHKYHWWPMKEYTNPVKALANNLYACTGGLDKYDKLFHVKAVEYQKLNHFRGHNSTKSDKDWSGFCDAATILSCTREYPKHSVKVHYCNDSQTFTPQDIEALMIITSYNTVQSDRSIFYGKRYNGLIGENKSEPYPMELLDMLHKITHDKVPFALDVCQESSVWNYSFDEVLVEKTSHPPKKYMKKIRLLNYLEDNVYYNFIIKSMAYPEKNINIWGWSNNSNGRQKQGWLSDKHPDFVWKKYPTSNEWDGMCNINPEISANNVYRIYKASIAGTEVVF